MANQSTTMAQTGISASWHLYLNRISAYVSVLAVYYISYIPFLFIFPYLGVDKITLFIIIALLNLSLILIGELPRAITGRIGFRKQNVLALCLYLVFALYTLCSYAVIGEFLNDVFTLRTLTLVNPIFVLFAISCLGNKKEVIIATFLFSFVYFVFLIQSMVQGNIQTGQMNILGTVFDMEERLDAYQNVNMYLGLFIISALYFMSRERAFYSIIAILSIILSIIGMFLIGGRASIVAVAVVILLYVWKSTIRGRRLGLSPTSLIISLCLVVSSVMIIIYWNYIFQFFQQSITVWRFSILFDNYDASGRLFLFTKALELFFTNIQTFLFGAGINSFPVYIGEYSKGMYPHNVLLELLCEYGIFGSVLFLAPIAYILLIRKKQYGTLYGDCIEENIVFLLGLYFWVHAMFTGDIGSSWVLIFFSFLLMPSRITEWATAKRIGIVPAHC